ncbi:MAG: hypothetical protein ABI999_03845 [Acidobacteriota bacterium]
MKPRVIWTLLTSYFLVCIGANILFVYLYNSRSSGRLENCVASATTGGVSLCFAAVSSADSAYSTLSQQINLIVIFGYLGVIVVTSRLFSNEKRIDELKRRIEELEGNQNA